MLFSRTLDTLINFLEKYMSQIIAGDCIGGMLQIAAAIYEGATAGTSAVKYIRGL